MSSLELRTLHQFNGLGVSETPDVKPLPWDRPGPKEIRMAKLSDWGTILGVVATSVGLILSLQALRGVMKDRSERQ